MSERPAFAFSAVGGSGCRRARLLGLVGAVVALVGAALPAVASADTETFHFTGGPQSWAVPNGVASVEFDLYGAEGSNNGNSGFVGGKGGRATATLDLSAGQVVHIYVGGAGGFATAGWNGGGYGFAGGGGGTDIRIGGTALTDRVLVAGGGGGVGTYGGAARGGDGGGLVGTSGSSPFAGAPGTQEGGGAGTWPGSLGQGGGGGTGSGAARGCGGGGYYGGGTNNEEGGGGSGYGPEGTVFETGVREGSGQVVITYTLIKHALDMTALGNGQGRVTSSPTGIDCGFGSHTDCASEFGEGAQVTLTAASQPGSYFSGWGGACSGSSATCQVTMSQARSVTATFVQGYSLSVAKSGTGSGSVSSNPAGIDCGTLCSDTAANFELGTSVTLTASPATGSTFAFWTGGGCSGSQNTCTVTVNQARNVQATFTLNEYTLAVTKQGGGTGTVTSAPGGINCGATCSANYTHGTSVTLAATPGEGSDFVGWSGDGCSDTDPSCTVTVDQARSVAATFTLQKRTLTVNKTGNGSGLVTSGPTGIDCGTDCAADFDYGTEVTLVPDPASGSYFAGWSGPCTGSGAACIVSLTEARSVEAEFTLERLPLTVQKAGNGAGTVTSTPTGTACGPDCMSFDYGTSVTLVASPSPESAFTGWTGACSGSATLCTVTMTEARSVGATFAPIPPKAAFTKVPKKTKRIKAKRTNVRFVFRSDQPGSAFQCNLNRRAFRACKSPLRFKVKRGKHTFQVRAVNAAGVTGSPAKYRFRVLKKR